MACTQIEPSTPGNSCLLGLTIPGNRIRIAETVGRCSMTTLTCPDCDLPGDGDCSVCHGKGKTLGDRLLGKVALFDDGSCSACGGSGHCATCGGIGEIEIGGESG